MSLLLWQKKRLLIGIIGIAILHINAQSKKEKHTDLISVLHQAASLRAHPVQPTHLLAMNTPQELPTEPETFNVMNTVHSILKKNNTRFIPIHDLLKELGVDIPAESQEVPAYIDLAQLFASLAQKIDTEPLAQAQLQTYAQELEKDNRVTLLSESEPETIAPILLKKDALTDLLPQAFVLQPNPQPSVPVETIPSTNNQPRRRQPQRRPSRQQSPSSRQTSPTQPTLPASQQPTSGSTGQNVPPTTPGQQPAQNGIPQGVPQTYPQQPFINRYPPIQDRPQLSESAMTPQRAERPQRQKRERDTREPSTTGSRPSLGYAESNIPSYTPPPSIPDYNYGFGGYPSSSTAEFKQLPPLPYLPPKPEPDTEKAAEPWVEISKKDLSDKEHTVPIYGKRPAIPAYIPPTRTTDQSREGIIDFKRLPEILEQQREQEQKRRQEERVELDQEITNPAANALWFYVKLCAYIIIAITAASALAYGIRWLFMRYR